MYAAAALIYWLIVAIWAAVFATLVSYYVRNPLTFGTTRLLLAVLAIDTARNIFENIYFGLYFGGQYGLLPVELVTVLGKPAFLIIPKILNVIAGCVVLGLLLYRWLPSAVSERGRAEQRAQDLENLAAVDGLTGPVQSAALRGAGPRRVGALPTLRAPALAFAARRRPLQAGQ